MRLQRRMLQSRPLTRSSRRPASASRPFSHLFSRRHGPPRRVHHHRPRRWEPHAPHQPPSCVGRRLLPTLVGVRRPRMTSCMSHRARTSCRCRRASQTQSMPSCRSAMVSSGGGTRRRAVMTAMRRRRVAGVAAAAMYVRRGCPASCSATLKARPGCSRCCQRLSASTSR